MTTVDKTFRHAVLVLACLAAGAASLALSEFVRLPSSGAGDATLSVPRLSAPPEMPRGHGFDVVRVERDGAILVAGRGTPHAKVEILVDAKAVLTVVADGSGNFVAMPADLVPGAHEIALAVVGPDGARAFPSGRVAVVVRDTGEPALVARIEPGRPTEILSDVEEGGPLAVSSADAGRLLVNGKAPPGHDVSLHLDGVRLASGRSNARGKVAFDVPGGAPRDRRIRLTSTDPSTHLPIASAEATFGLPSREARDGVGSEARIQVAAGQTLWRIGKSAYGRGERYTVIFAANKGTLSSPHRIYPGQALVIPRP